MKSKIALAASSLASRSNYLNLKKFSYLIVLVQPKESQISHAYWLPVILNLLPCAIYYMSNFVRYYELKVLRVKLMKTLQLRPIDPL